MTAQTASPPALAPVKPTPDTRRERRRDIWRDCLWGAFSACIALAVCLIVESSQFGRFIEEWSYSLLIHSQNIPDDDSNLPIVIDISDLPYSYTKKNVPYNPRPALQKLITDLSALHPRAIGLDIDFARLDSGEFVDSDNDPDFFRFCRDSTVPIILGAYRRVWSDDQPRLGAVAFDKIAGDMSIPEDTRKLSYWIKPAKERDDLLPSFSAAVANAATDGKVLEEAQTEAKTWKFKSLFIESTSKLAYRDGRAEGEFLNNLGALPHIPALSFAEVTAHRHLQKEGRIFLIGRVERSYDKFVVTGNPLPVPGVKLHACGVYTLLTVRLYEMRRLTQIGLDILVSGIMLYLVAQIRLSLLKRYPNREVRTEKLGRIVACVLALAVPLAAFAFCYARHWLWIDFIPLATVLMLHTKLERAVSRTLEIARKIAALFLNYILKPESVPPR